MQIASEVQDFAFAGHPDHLVAIQMARQKPCDARRCMCQDVTLLGECLHNPRSHRRARLQPSIVEARQGKMKCRALTKLAFHPDAATVQLDQFLADGQSQSRSPRRAGLGLIGNLGLLKFAEQAGDVLIRDAGPSVLNRDHHVSIFFDRPHNNTAAFRKAHGVGEQIERHLSQAHAVAQYQGQVVGELLVNVQALSFGKGTNGGDALLERLVDIQAILGQWQSLGFDL